MKQAETFHHALKFKYDLCIGCSHCIGACPTAAIHVEKGKPILNPNRCIDCGRCYLACPVSAIYIEQDDFQTIYNYKFPILLVPSIFSAQFPEKINHRAIVSAIHHLGFKYIFEVEKSVDILTDVMNKAIIDKNLERPIISTYCPAVVRLIQVKFPSLVKNLFLVKPPLDITALFIKQKFTDEGVKEEDIGIFYVSPCAAKIAAIKSPVGDDVSMVDGVINMNFFYNKVYRTIKQGTYQLVDEECASQRLACDNLLWSLTKGEINLLSQGRNLAIDEIHNVSDFLEKVENEDITDIDYLELRACDESCAGGILCPGNRFFAAERQKKRAESHTLMNTPRNNDLLKYEEYLLKHLSVGEVLPRSMEKLDNNIAVAMRKMKKSFELNNYLPQVDCRICGYQTCKELAHAIVNENADLKQCIFIQRILEQTDKLTPAEALKINKVIWGEKKFDKNSLKGINLGHEGRIQ